jgi:hypothetical protein
MVLLGGSNTTVTLRLPQAGHISRPSSVLVEGSARAREAKSFGARSSALDTKKRTREPSALLARDHHDKETSVFFASELPPRV